eukprot:GGOE01037942.1.p1 GENE.GGOE01037942.1~~GGOE01037942.1.p1  ORF type:complete len:1057 (-),score=333.16 GGOE01037942.1:224-3247(-)
MAAPWVCMVLLLAAIWLGVHRWWTPSCSASEPLVLATVAAASSPSSRGGAPAEEKTPPVIPAQGGTLAALFDSSAMEDKWYRHWLAEGMFRADATSPKPPYSIVLPPPNVTGALHMGHALGDTLQDILIRWRRMSGYEVLWVPGTDHAGIATQTVVEQHLMEQTGKSRKEFSQEEFLGHVWAWKEANEHRILTQMQKLGCSCDWSRQRFTMDAESNAAVRTLFKRMFDAGLIYRGDYLVNWDPVTQTALADDEVDYEDQDSVLWYFCYPLEEEGGGYLTVATTRPETMLGDVAVAVSPDDPRYAGYVGRTVRLPIVGRSLPIIADPFVKQEFGTGAVKVTPAHDPNDWEMAQRHHLPCVNIMNPDGTLNENGGEFQGLTMEAARGQVVERMRALGFLHNVEPHRNRVGKSYRSKAVVEPYVSKQWFVKMERFKQPLVDAVKEKHVRLIPDTWETTYFHWIQHLRDWCISRQLWWGHRIPVWHHRADPERVLCFDGDGLPPEVAADPSAWRQDEDVLDTWFSSALWPFSALGWPKDTADLRRFYPTNVLVTGHDILFFWVARMILMGQYAMGAEPFRDVSLVGLIYGKSYWRVQEGSGVQYVTAEEKAALDAGQTLPGVEAKWEKMSKSKGNVLDPIAMVDKYGADAVRMALAASTSHSEQIDLDSRRFEEQQSFMIKVWNATRFVMMHLKLSPADLMAGLDPALLTLEDHWILSRLNTTIKEVSAHLEGFFFDRAAKLSHAFLWDEFCAYYVELVKPALYGRVGTDALRCNKQRVLLCVLLAGIRLLHPMAPFITEEIFALLKGHFPHLKPAAMEPYTADAIRALLSPACMVSPFPQVIVPMDIRPEVEAEFQAVCDAVYVLRNVRGEVGFPQNMPATLIIEGDAAWLMAHDDMLKALVRIDSIQANPAMLPTGPQASATVRGLRFILPIPPELEAKERARLEKERQKLNTEIEAMQKQLNPNFLGRAPLPVVEKARASLVALEAALQEVLTRLHWLASSQAENVHG